jgi:hypothetical protein
VHRQFVGPGALRVTNRIYPIIGSLAAIRAADHCRARDAAGRIDRRLHLQDRSDRPSAAAFSDRWRVKR